MSINSTKKRLTEVENKLNKEPVRLYLIRSGESCQYIDGVIENFGTPEQFTRKPTSKEYDKYGSEDNPIKKSRGGGKE